MKAALTQRFALWSFGDFPVRSEGQGSYLRLELRGSANH
jgi:hypothetical protein